MLRRISIRTQLFALTLGVALPLVGLVAWNLYAVAKALQRSAAPQAQQNRLPGGL